MDIKSFELIVKSERSAKRFLVKACWGNHLRFCIACKKHGKSTESDVPGTDVEIVGTSSPTSQADGLTNSISSAETGSGS